MGAGRADETVAAFRQLFSSVPSESALLVDADALEALLRADAGEAPPARSRSADRTVATPNEGEYQRLFGRSETPEPEASVADVRRRAREAGVTLVAKGEVDRMSDGERVFRTRHRNAATTVGGVGDVLSGVIGGLLAQGVSGLEAARLGTQWVAAAGDRVFETRSYGLLATDVIAELPATLRDGLARVRAGGA
jgi:NAD(P)H-hydrate epimerase